MEIIAKWEVYDGYVGKSRPQETKFNTDDIMDEDDWFALSDDEKHEIIEEAVQADYEDKISFEIEDYGI